jgi:two-component system chemotaxis response regulator CheB
MNYDESLKSLKKLEHNVVIGFDQEVYLVSQRTGIFIYAENEVDQKIRCLFLDAIESSFEKNKSHIDLFFEQQFKKLKPLKIKIIGKSCYIDYVKLLSKENTYIIKKEEIIESEFDIIFDGKTKKMLLSKEKEIPTVKIQEKLKVVIVDDSKVIRDLLTRALEKNTGCQVVGSFENPTQFLQSLPTLKVDCITLDIHMPDMDGVTCLKKYIQQYPIPTVMVSSVGLEEGGLVLNALDSGAIDYIQKPQQKEIQQFSEQLWEKVSTASLVDVRSKINRMKLTKRQDHVSQKIPTKNLISTGRQLWAIGSSTGGPEALQVVLSQFPQETPPILIVQHIPAIFSLALAKRLNDVCQIYVKEGEDGEIVLSSTAYIAPGGKQMKVKAYKDELRIQITDDDPINRHKPSVDYLFNSLSLCSNKKITASILTGMGNDGAKGLLALKKQGAMTLAQDKESCVVFGMPRVAIELEAHKEIVKLDKMPYYFLQSLK